MRVGRRLQTSHRRRTVFRHRIPRNPFFCAHSCTSRVVFCGGADRARIAHAKHTHTQTHTRAPSLHTASHNLTTLSTSAVCTRCAHGQSGSRRGVGGRKRARSVRRSVGRTVDGRAAASVVVVVARTRSERGTNHRDSSSARAREASLRGAPTEAPAKQVAVAPAPSSLCSCRRTLLGRALPVSFPPRGLREIHSRPTCRNRPMCLSETSTPMQAGAAPVESAMLAAR